MTVKPWTLLEERPGELFGYIVTAARRYRMPTGHEAHWDVLVQSDMVGVIALTRDDQVVVIDQFRPGPGKVLTEVPAGRIDTGESTLEAAQRELREETGYTSEQMVLAGSMWSGASSTRRGYAVLALNARQTDAQHLEPEEDILVRTMPLDAFLEHLRRGETTSVAIGWMAIDMLRRIRLGC